MLLFDVCRHHTLKSAYLKSSLQLLLKPVTCLYHCQGKNAYHFIIFLPLRFLAFFMLYDWFKKYKWFSLTPFEVAIAHSKPGWHHLTKSVYTSKKSCFSRMINILFFCLKGTSVWESFKSWQVNSAKGLYLSGFLGRLLNSSVCKI